MGTPEFAVASLQAIFENGYEIGAVITATDKPSGRGLKATFSAVKEYALANQLPILQPEKLKNPEFLAQLEAINADVFVIVAFRMLPEVVWQMPKKGTFNLHGSLLPDYRGAAPIHWAVINGETETGVTTFFLKQEIDTGEIIFQEKENILADDTTGSLYERLMHKGANLVVKTLEAIENENVKTFPQAEKLQEKSAPKLFKEHGLINWGKSAREIHNLVRGLNPFPCAYSQINGKSYKILKTQIVTDTEKQLEIAEIYTDQKTFIYIGTANGVVSILELQAEGKRKMNVKDFLQGNKI